MTDAGKSGPRLARRPFMASGVAVLGCATALAAPRQGRERVEGGAGGALEGPDAPVEAVADEVHGPPVEHELAAHERATLVPAVTEHDALADEPLADRHPPLSPAAVTRPAAPLR
jgi:hypothetical protein